MPNLIVGDPTPIGRMTKRKAFILQQLAQAPSQTLLKREILELAARDRGSKVFHNVVSFERSFRRTMDGAIGPARDAAFVEQRSRGVPVGVLVRVLMASRRLSGHLPSPNLPAQLGFCLDADYAVPVLFEGDAPCCILPPLYIGTDAKPPFLTLREQLTDEDVRPHSEVDVRIFGHLGGSELAPLDPTMLSKRLRDLPEYRALNGVQIGLLSQRDRYRLR